MNQALYKRLIKFNFDKSALHSSVSILIAIVFLTGCTSKELSLLSFLLLGGGVLFVFAYIIMTISKSHANGKGKKHNKDEIVDTGYHFNDDDSGCGSCGCD